MRQVTSRSGNSRKFTRAPLAWILGVALSVASAPLRGQVPVLASVWRPPRIHCSCSVL